MTCELIVLTHGKIGEALLQAVSDTFGELTMPTQSLSFSPTQTSDRLRSALQEALARCRDECLILTDLFGATPCNIAHQTSLHLSSVAVLSGVNLPMLLKIMNYPRLSLHELVKKALDGGQQGVVLCRAAMQKRKAS